MDNIKEHALQALLPLFQNSEECVELREQLQEARREIAVLQERCRLADLRAKRADHQAQRQMRANATAKGGVAALLASLSGQGTQLLRMLDANAYDDAAEAQRQPQRSYDDHGAGKLAFLKRSAG